MELFIRSVRKYNALEKIPVKVGPRHDLYHSERHMLDEIGDKPETNVTDFASALGVTKGAVSQLVKKLEGKGVVRRYKKGSSEKEVFVALTKAGKAVYLKHRKTNAETIKPLLRELEKYPDDKVQFLLDMFYWIDAFLAQSGKDMEGRH